MKKHLSNRYKSFRRLFRRPDFISYNITIFCSQVTDFGNSTVYIYSVKSDMNYWQST